MSFYGGKQGRTYNIVKSYSSVAEMLSWFSKGGAYTDVNYGQYVLISPNNLSDYENGLLYRRGLNYQETFNDKPKPDKNDIDGQHYKYYYHIVKMTDGQGNEIQQQINIPSGPLPIDKTFNEEKYFSDFLSWAQNPGAGAIYVGRIAGPPGSAPVIKIEDLDTFTSHSSVHTTASGSTISGSQVVIPGWVPASSAGVTSVYNDTVTAAFANVEDVDGNITQAHFTLQIPYTVFQATLDADAYKQPKVERVVKDSESGITGDNVLEHPFYYKWKFTVPSGKHGKNIKQFNIEFGQNIYNDYNYKKTTDTVIDSQKSYYTYENEQFTIVAQPSVENIGSYYQRTSENVNKDSLNNDITDGDQYLTYSTQDFQTLPEGQIENHLGRWPYRVIDNITAINNSFSVLNQVNGDAELGNLILLSEENHLYCICIKAGSFDIDLEQLSSSTLDLGTVFSSGDNDDQEYNSLWRVIKIEGVAPPRSLDVDYTYGNDDVIDVPSLDFVFMDNLGNLYLKRRYTLVEEYVKTSDNQINEEKTYFIQDNGQYTQVVQPSAEDLDNYYEIIYNQEKTQNVFIGSIKRITQITALPQDIRQPQVINAIYEENGIPSTELIGTINSVIAADRIGDSLIILYSDPSYRQTLIDNGQLNVDYVLKEYSDGVTYPWKKIGPLGSQYHILGKYTLKELKEWYPYGFGSPLNNTNDYYEDLNTGDLIYYSSNPFFISTVITTIVDGEEEEERRLININDPSEIRDNFTAGDDESRQGWVALVERQYVDNGETFSKLELYAYDYNSPYPVGPTQISKYTILENNENVTGTFNWKIIESLEGSVVTTQPKKIIVVKSENTNDQDTDLSNLQIDGIWLVTSTGLHFH